MSGRNDNAARKRAGEMQIALERCFVEPAVKAVLVDPIVSNGLARRFYERLDFRFAENLRLGKEDSALSLPHRGEWPR